MSTKRDVVELLKLHELQDIAERFDLFVRDRRVRDDLVDAVVRSKKARLRDLLADLSRDRLKDICVGLDLDDTGREKQLLVDRLLGEESRDETEDAGVETSVNHDLLLRELMGAMFVPDTTSNAWPALGTLRVGALERKVQIYARLIGGSARGNAMERRFQNPSAAHAIFEPGDQFPLLLGLWQEQGDERTVVVAFDAYRRVGKATRYSMFMPLALLEQAADTGFAIHVNNKNETLYAFRPENLGRYIHILINEGVFLPSADDTDETPVVSRARTDRMGSVDPTSTKDRLYIRPRVGMYSAFARLNYKPWFAIAEFLDNSIQSFLHQKDALIAAGHDGPLIIDVSLDDNELSVTDRAGGIAWKDFPRAFSPAAAPDDASGLSEFGLGMKAAACWFSKLWSVRTSALGEPVERTVTFDIPTISRDGIENLPIELRPARESDHFTVVTMRDLRQRPRGKTLTKIKEHLASIYRVLMKEGVVKIRFTTSGRTDELQYEEPELLEAPFFREPTWAAQRWFRKFRVDLGDRRVTGWAGILKDGSYPKAGFSVFRRQRLIEGSVGETYKPHAIFGAQNSFTSLRVVGELFVDGFDVTHTKDGIQWNGHEDDVIENIRSQVNTPGMPLLDQAHGYRSRKTADTLPDDFGSDALEGVELGLRKPEILAVLRAVPVIEEVEYATGAGSPTAEVLKMRALKLEVFQDGQPWTFLIELVRDPAAPFYDTASIKHKGDDVLSVKVNLDHDFSVKYLNENQQALEPMLRFIAALALSEKLARTSGVKYLGVLRSKTNDVLRALAAGDRT